MNSNYMIWRSEEIEDACVLDQINGFEDLWELTEGVPQGATFPQDVSISMDPDNPYDTQMPDNLENTHMLIIASRRLKEFLEEWNIQKVEYLPVTILNHKGRIASKDYFIIHLIDPVNCLKLDECGVKWDTLDEECIDTLERLVIDESKVEPNRLLFRPNYFEDVMLVRGDLAEAIDAQGFTGIRWVKLGDFGS